MYLQYPTESMIILYKKGVNSGPNALRSPIDILHLTKAFFKLNF